MKKIIVSLAAVSALALSACSATVEATAPVPDTHAPQAIVADQDTRGDMYVPEVMGDPYYSAGDVFEVTDDGYLYMIGTGGQLRDDVDWLVMQGTFPIGYYVLDDTGALVPVQAWEVSAWTTTA